MVVLMTVLLVGCDSWAVTDPDGTGGGTGGTYGSTDDGTIGGL